MRKIIFLEQFIDFFEKRLSDSFYSGLSPQKKLNFIVEYYKTLYYGKEIEELLKQQNDVKVNLVYTEFIKRFLSNDSNVYMIADKFGYHLSKTNLDLPRAVIPMQDEKYYCFEFPIVFDNGYNDFHKVAVIGLKDISFRYDKPEGYSDSITIIAPDFENNGNWKGSNSFITLHFNKELNTLEKSVKSAFKIRSHEASVTEDFVSYVIKCLLYVESGEPDLQPKYKAPKVKTKAKLRKFFRDFCPFEVISVGYRFQKEHLYHIESTSVRGHFRWQPWGEGRTKVKLIWIDEHSRNYKNVYSNS